MLTTSRANCMIFITLNITAIRNEKNDLFHNFLSLSFFPTLYQNFSICQSPLIGGS
jgi:hypothetical protein